MNNKERSISEILLTLEHKVDNLTKAISANNQINTLILNRLNISAPPAKNTPDVQPQKVKTKTAPPPIQPEVKTEAVKEDIIEEGAKISVGQRVVDTKGKDVIMADINIYNMSGDLYLKTKTNAVGKWQAYLPPNTYKIKVSKTDLSTSKKIEKDQLVEIFSSAKTTQLDKFVIER